jgi:hypothetical protein
MRHPRFVTLLYRPLHVSVLAMVGLWLAGCADGGPSAPGDATATPDFAITGNVTELELRGDFVLLKWDGAVRVFLRARCPAGYRVIEGPVTVTETPETQEIFGEGFFTTTCDGRWRRLSVRVASTDARFHPGRAQVSAALMVENDAGDFQQGDDTGVLRITR